MSKSESKLIEQSWIDKYAKSKEYIQVYESDSANNTAYKIFGGFKVNQSCSVQNTEKAKSVWAKLSSLAKRKGNYKKFRNKEFGGINNFYRVQ